MAKRGGRQVFLGAQWDLNSWGNLLPLCDLLIDKVGRRSLVWNLPAQPPDSPRRTRAWLEKTIGPRIDLDLIAAMGFAGACHPVLALDELEKELSWGVENPWGTGIFQLLRVRPDVLLPRVPDLYRADALKIYGAHGFRTLGIPDGRRSGLAWFTGAGLECFTCTRIAVADFGRSAPGARALRRMLPGRGDVLLLLDLSGQVTLEELDQTLERMAIPWLAPEGTPSPLRAAPSATRDLDSLAPEGLDWSPFPDPFLRQLAAATAGSARKKRRKNEEYRHLLMSHSQAPGQDRRDASREDASRGGAQLVAQMLGEVALAGNGFDVRLVGGRFSGITRAGQDCLPPRPARSYLRVGGKTLHFRTRNSFSFEREGVIGLREVLAIDSQERSELSIEYSFAEGCPMLEITAQVRWPELAPEAIVEEHAPLVISLRELGRGDEARIESAAPDGSVSSLRVVGDSWMVIPGCLHRVALGRGGALLLRPGPMGTNGWNLASYRVAREGRRRFLEANPFGGWFPLRAPALSARREEFSLLIGLEDDGAGEKGRS